MLARRVLRAPVTPGQGWQLALQRRGEGSPGTSPSPRCSGTEAGWQEGAWFSTPGKRESLEIEDAPRQLLQEAPGLPYLWSSETQGAEWRLPTQFSRPSAIRVWGPEACDVSLSEAGAGARLSTRTHRVLWHMLTDPRQPAENRRSSVWG